MRTVLLLLLLASSPLFGQQTEATRAKQFTLSLPPQYKRAQETFSLQHFEAAYGWSRRQNRMFEIGLKNILATTQEYRWYGNERYETPVVHKRRSLGLNAVQYYFLQTSQDRFQVFAGAGWQSLLSFYKQTPGILSGGRQVVYAAKDCTWTNTLFLLPGVQYRFSNLLIKLEVPITLIQTESTYIRVEYPQIPKKRQQQTRFTPSYFPFETLSIELGIGYRLYQ